MDDAHPSAAISRTITRPAAFPVSPGAEMPPVEGRNKHDDAVLIEIGVALEA